VHTLAAGSETGHSPEQLEAVRAAVAKLNDVRLKVRIRCDGYICLLHAHGASARFMV